MGFLRRSGPRDQPRHDQVQPRHDQVQPRHDQVQPRHDQVQRKKTSNDFLHGTIPVEFVHSTFHSSFHEECCSVMLHPLTTAMFTTLGPVSVAVCLPSRHVTYCDVLSLVSLMRDIYTSYRLFAYPLVA
ncbi:hypothetical protein BaRGS_00010289 [Batillaria attramentaria]|uniref:Uncharacterized protein n=1 Tax=Batillaria attramentaria TaxID=370345 RepID=A0ABD0LGB0_9CAEN